VLQQSVQLQYGCVCCCVAVPWSPCLCKLHMSALDVQRCCAWASMHRCKSKRLAVRACMTVVFGWQQSSSCGGQLHYHWQHMPIMQ